MEWDGEVNMRYQPWYISIPGKSTMRILSTYLHAGPSNTTVTTFHEPHVNHEQSSISIIRSSFLWFNC